MLTILIAVFVACVYFAFWSARRGNVAGVIVFSLLALLPFGLWRWIRS